MQVSPFIIEREPLKYGGQQEDYQRRMKAIVAWGARQIKETPKEEKALVELFFRLLECFIQERQNIAQAHQTSCKEQFGRKRDEYEGTKDFYHTILDDAYKDYNSKILTILANHLRGMSLENKQTSKKQKKIDGTYLGRLSSLEIEIFESEDLKNLKWLSALTPSDCPLGFPAHLTKKREEEGKLSSKEWNTLKQATKRMKEEHPLIYKRMKMTSLLLELQKEYPSPMKIPSPRGIELIGKEANLKSVFVLATVRLEVQGKLYAITQYLTWLYRDFAIHPVDRMLNCSTVMVIHQDNFLIKDTLEEIALIFAKAVLTNKENQSEFTGLFRHYFANNMPCERGSASIGEMFEGSIYGAQDLEVTYNPEKQIDLEALTSPLLSLFMENYRSMINLKPILPQ